MTTRFLGLVPAFALLAVGAAHAQVGNQTGNMAYPTPNASGEVRIPSPTARDTGNMAYPASPGGVPVQGAMGTDTGNMATPAGRSSLNTRGTRMAAMRGDPANSMRPDVAPTPAQTQMAQSLDMAPSAAPVPYTDFLPATRAMGSPMMGRRGMMMHKGMHRPMHARMMHKAAANPAAAPATPEAPAK